MKKPRAKRPPTRNPRPSSAIPSPLVVDNGIGFTSDAIREAMQNLGISLVALRTRDPLRKPEIERAFKRLDGRFKAVPATAQTPSRSSGKEPK